VPGFLHPLIARTTWRRWTYLVLGGTLSVPFLVVSMVVSSVAPPSLPWGLHLLLWLVAFIGPMMLIGLDRSVRTLVGGPAQELLGAPATVGEGRSLQARVRTSLWLTGHILVGTVVSVLSLGLPAATVFLGSVPFGDHAEGPLKHFHGWAGVWLPLPGLLAIVGLVYLTAGIGVVGAKLAERLLGPSSEERLAEVERRADALAERNRLARELHDSVGHALSIVTVQAAAAGRVLERDTEFVRLALAAIEESARGALEDLDHVLGLLREEQRAATAPQRTLRDLDDLLRLTGLPVEARLEGDPARVPAAVSREAYRIVQEGLTNALRHAGEVPVSLRLAVDAERLELEMSNPLRAGQGGDGRSGGRGLPGIRERVSVLRGEMTAGADDGQWRIAVSIPFKRTA
jgi:signal transduction histidine kinase